MRYSNNVLTIGCECQQPKGGVASVLNSYMNNVYRPFKFVANSGGGGKLSNLWMMLRSCVQCERIEHRDEELQFVHIHTASYISFWRSAWYIRQAKRNRKKVIVHIHGGAFREYRKKNLHFVDKHLSMCDAVITLSEGWKKYFTESVGLSNVHVIPNIIANPKDMNVAGDGKFHLLFLGAINDGKGIFDLLDVIRDMKEVWQDRIVLHVGGNDQVDRFKKTVNDYGLNAIVIYEGWVSGDKKAELFNLADAYILPSYIEGLPISILEAMSYGVPVLSTKVGGIPEVVRTNSNGILFEPGDKKAMREAIESMLSSRELYDSMSVQCKQDARPYLPVNVSSNLESLYSQLLLNE